MTMNTVKNAVKILVKTGDKTIAVAASGGPAVLIGGALAVGTVIIFDALAQKISQKKTPLLESRTV